MIYAEIATENDYDLAKSWMNSQEDQTQYLLNQVGDQPLIMKVENAKTVQFNMDQVESINTEKGDGGSIREGNRNLNMILEPTLPDINKLATRRSERI